MFRTAPAMPPLARNGEPTHPREVTEHARFTLTLTLLPDRGSLTSDPGRLANERHVHLGNIDTT